MKKTVGKNYTPLILGLILIFGIILRFYDLGEPSFFNDELETWRIASYPTVSATMEEGVVPDVHPPGYQLIMYFVVHNFGESEFWLRLPSAIFGSLAILAIYFLGKLFYGRKEGLITSALTAFLWAPLYFSQEARAYSLLFLLAIVTSYYWFKILSDYKKSCSLRGFPTGLYVLFSIFLCYVHYAGLLLVALQGLAVFLLSLKFRKGIGLTILFYFVIALAYLPWARTFLTHLRTGAEWISEPSVLAFGYYLIYIFNMSPFVTAAVLALFAMFVYKIAKTGISSSENIFAPPETILLSWLIIPFAVVFVKSIIANPSLTYNSMLICAPPAYILLARAIATIAKKDAARYAIAGALIAVIFFSLIFELDYYSNPYKQNVEFFGNKYKKRAKEQFGEASEYFIERRDKGKTEIIAACAWFPDYFEYYFRKNGYNGRIDLIACDIKDSSKINKAVDSAGAERFWLLRGHRTLDSSLVHYLDDKYKRADYAEFAGAEVLLYENSR